MRQIGKFPVCLAAITAMSLPGMLSARAGQVDLCISCADPRQTYVCRVETPKGSPGEKALQLYCIIKTAKHGGHSACSVSRTGNAECNGPVMSHVYDGPVMPEILRSNIPAQPTQLPGQNASGLDVPKQKGGEPGTLIEMSGPAANAGKSAARSTGRAVRNAAGGTGHTIGTIGKKAGRGVGNTAKSAGEVARDAGSAVGGAARYTYSCLRSFFRHCGETASE